MVFLLQQRCKNNKSFSIQVLSRHIVSFSILYDDDESVFMMVSDQMISDSTPLAYTSLMPKRYSPAMALSQEWSMKDVSVTWSASITMFDVAGIVGQRIGHVVPVVDSVAKISGKLKP